MAHTNTIALHDAASRFASDLGWAPGDWPKITVIDGVRVMKTTPVTYEGEFAGYLYVGLVMQATRFIVYND